MCNTSITPAHYNGAWEDTYRAHSRCCVNRSEVVNDALNNNWNSSATTMDIAPVLRPSKTGILKTLAGNMPPTIAMDAGINDESERKCAKVMRRRCALMHTDQRPRCRSLNLCWFSLKWRQGRSSLMSIPPFGRGFQGIGSFDPMEVWVRKNVSCALVHRLDEPTGLSLGMVGPALPASGFTRQDH